MIFKLGLSAERSWRRLRGFQWLTKVIDGMKFRDGIEVQQRVRKTGNLGFPRFPGHYPKPFQAFSNSSGLTRPRVECRRRGL